MPLLSTRPIALPLSNVQRGMLLVGLFCLAGCEFLGDTSVPDYAAISEISYTRHVNVLFEDSCVACHEGGDTLDLTSWSGLVEGGPVGGIVVPFDPERSRLMRMLTQRTGAPHPSDVGADTLTTAQVDFLRRWIAAGARSDLDEVPYTSPGPRALVTLRESAEIVVLSLQQEAIQRVISLPELGFSPSSRPSDLVASGDRASWFVSLPGEGLVLRFDSLNVLTGLVEIEGAGALATSTDGAYLIVARERGSSSGTVQSVSTDEMRVTPLATAFPETIAAAIRPQGDYGFTVSRPADQLVGFPLDGGPATYQVLTGPRHEVFRLAYSDDGTRLVAFGEASGEAMIMDTTTPGSPTLTGRIQMGSGLRSADLDGDQIVALGATGDLMTAPVSAGATPVTIAGLPSSRGVVARSGLAVVIASTDGGGYTPGQPFDGVSQTGVVYLVDTATGLIKRTIEIDGRPTSVAIR